MRICSKCKTDRPLDQFGKRSRAKDGLDTHCKPCRSEYYLANRERQIASATAWNNANKDQAARNRRACTLRQYGLTIEQHEAMLQEQGGQCKLCIRPAEVVDHCHSSGKVRGLLCNNCNHVLGKMQDDPWLLRRAAEYLEEAKWKTS